MAVLGLIGLIVCVLSLLRNVKQGLLRTLATTLLYLSLFNPSLIREEREPVKNIVGLVVDSSGSQTLDNRIAQTQQAKDLLMQRLKTVPNLDVKLLEMPPSRDNNGTELFKALSNAVSDLPSDRLSGLIIVTDGIVHDVPQSNSFKAPLHVLVTGHERERERKLTLLQNPRFGIVGRDLSFQVTIHEQNGTGSARVILKSDGKVLETRTVATNQVFSMTLKPDHAGTHLIELETDALEQELTTANNRAFFALEGIREKMRVLLVSGEPHAGERTWRNLLKSDANVDLIHFTILRPPEKQDGTPIQELSLIAFPTHELFQEKLAEFDLVVFDRFANQSVLPSLYYDNLARYVKNGGALLVAAGPEYTSTNSLARTRLESILPALPNGRVREEAFRPALSELGQRHPVTRDLPDKEIWGSWLRLIGSTPRSGYQVLSGPDNTPLLLLSREEKGRMALLLSDQIWLWARGFEGGGPYNELIRRLSNWLMKEPSLEEEAVKARVDGNTIHVTRQTIKSVSEPVTMTAPNGTQTQLDLKPDQPGLFSVSLQNMPQGLYRFSSSPLNAFASVGPLNPLELSDVISTLERLKPVAEASQGSIRRIEDENTLNIPHIRMVQEGARLSGANWIGLITHDKASLRGFSEMPLTLGFWGLAVVLGVLSLWFAERGRKEYSRFN